MRRKVWINVILVVVSLALAGGGVFANHLGKAKGTIMGTVKNARTNKPIKGARILIKEIGLSAVSNGAGLYAVTVPAPGSYTVICMKPGYANMSRKTKVGPKGKVKMDFRLVSLKKKPKPEPKPAMEMKEEAVMMDMAAPTKKMKLSVSGGRGKGIRSRGHRMSGRARHPAARPAPRPDIATGPGVKHDTEAYDKITDNPFKSASKDPLSTFSIDVDTASYANARRFITQQHRLPPKDAVRIEEFVNYFTYDYPDAKGEHPFSVTTEISSAPWNGKHRLALIGLQGKKIDTKKLPPFNLVFLMDVSGSMNSPQKLPLLKAAFKLLVNQMRPTDRVAIVVYAGAAGVVLPPTSGKERGKILDALDRLRAGGSTAGGAGIKLAYKLAKDNFVKGGNNRIILATDGDFNVGASSDSEMVRLIEEKRKLGIYLTVLGFGSGNYKDSKMEKLADKGNGNYAYIDSILEAKKVLVKEMGSTLLTIAKDVKLQVEFNPAKVKAYRLIGYENRIMAHQDFNDDKKDAGEMGAGHSVTAFYEIIPAGSKEEVPGIDELKYQKTVVTDAAKKSDELMTVKLRYKPPKEDKSTLIVHPVKDQGTDFRKATMRFRFATAVVEFGLILRDSPYKANATIESLLARAKATIGNDPGGYRFEFLQLVKKAEALIKANKK